MDKISTIAKNGLLVLVGMLAFILASRWAGVRADAIIGLTGAIVGAVIAASIQFFTTRIEQIDRYRLAAIDKRLQAHQEAFALWRLPETHWLMLLLCRRSENLLQSPRRNLLTNNEPQPQRVEIERIKETPYLM